MIPDPAGPIIVGAAAIQQRIDDPTAAREAMLLMRDVLDAAAGDAGSRALLDAADVVMMPQGMWSSANPAAVVAPFAARSIVADIGVLQQTLISRACSMVATGEANVVLVCGAEAKYRDLRARIAGVTVGDTPTAGAPGQRLIPAHEIITRAEVERGLGVPARQYALIDTAIRHADGVTPAEHIASLAALQARFSDIAAANPDAWNRTAVDAATVRGAPMLAWPYTKLHCSQWNVDQAAGLIVCSTTAAARFGIARDRWVFAHLGVESNLMVPVTLRAEIHRSPAVDVVGAAIRERLGVEPADIDHLDLYSCFPAAVRMQVRELGIDPQRQLTITGGMTFAGGPLNSYTLQALVSMTHVLRSDPSANGLVTNVSGMLTKFGASVWSSRPPLVPYASVDVTSAASAATARATLDADYVGPARVITYTVACDKGAQVLGIVVAESAAGIRAVATTTDSDTMADMMQTEWCARDITVAGPGFVAGRL